MSDHILRRAIIDEACTWLDTPYQHQASAKGAGCDCLGLVRGVWRAIYGEEPSDVPAYTPDWAERSGQETLRDAALLYLKPTELKAAQAGDVLLFRMSPSAPAKHVAIKTAPDKMIHAYWGRAVTQTLIIPYWQRRIAYAYAFPKIDLKDF